MTIRAGNLINWTAAIACVVQPAIARAQSAAGARPLTVIETFDERLPLHPEDPSNKETLIAHTKNTTICGDGISFEARLDSRSSNGHGTIISQRKPDGSASSASAFIDRNGEIAYTINMSGSNVNGSDYEAGEILWTNGNFVGLFISQGPKQPDPIFLVIGPDGTRLTKPSDQMTEAAKGSTRGQKADAADACSMARGDHPATPTTDILIAHPPSHAVPGTYRVIVKGYEHH